MRKFSSKYEAEARDFGFDFADRLEATEAITTATFTLDDCSGIDPDAGMYVGSAVVQGTLAQVRITGGTAGSTYLLDGTVTLSSGRILTAQALLPVV